MMQMSPPRTDLIAAARNFIGKGRLDEADRLIDDVLAVDPGHADALAIRASTLLARGDKDRAALIFSELATLHPDRADVVADLGVTHMLEGRTEEALFCFERALALHPEELRHRVSIVKVLISLNNITAAKPHISALLTDAKAAHNLDFQAEAYALGARLAAVEGDLFASETLVREALGLRPGNLDDLCLLSNLAADLNREDEALATAQAAYLQAPMDHDVVAMLVRRLMEAGRFEDAELHLRRILATAPYHLEANHLFAALLIQKGEGARALAQFAAIVRRMPDNPDAVMRMAGLARAAGDLERALSFAHVAVGQEGPQSSAAKALHDDILLALGRIEEVWPANTEDADRPLPAAIAVPLAMPAGDAMLFLRFARRLAPEGERIPCHVEPDLLPLLAGVSGIVPTSEPAPPGTAPITVLPDILGVGEDLATLPYLAVEEERHARWAEAMAHLPRPFVGLFWDETATGLTLDALVGAIGEGLEGEGTLVSLAFGKRRDQLSAFPDIVDAGAHFSDALEMVGAIAQLDLTVGASSLALHVAGALGRPGVVAVPAYQPWVWAAREGGSLWYPSLGVATQKAPGAWDTVCTELAAAAREAVQRVTGKRIEGEEG